MKLNILIIVVLVGLCGWGCQSLEDVRRNARESSAAMGSDLRDAFKTISKDYLHSNKWYRDKLKEVEFIAHEHLMETVNKDYYNVWNPIIDQEEMMPEAHLFHFVHFRSIDEKFQGTTYLVVIRSEDHEIVYVNVFPKPLGDWFYRYREILKQIK